MKDSLYTNFMRFRCSMFFVKEIKSYFIFVFSIILSIYEFMDLWREFYYMKAI